MITILFCSSLTVHGEIAEGVEEVVYFGSKQTYDGYCRPEIMQRIGLASALMSSLRRCGIAVSSVLIPKSMSTVHLYNLFFFYGPETWMLLASDIKKLEAFH